MKRPAVLAIVAAMVAMYFLIVYLGLGYFNSAKIELRKEPRVWADWTPPDPLTIQHGPSGDSIRYGINLFNKTPWYAPQYTGGKLACSSCHIEGGIAPYASPMVGLLPLFPMYNKRAGHMISLKDRIQECFTRSENGHPLPYDSREMTALVDYIQWLSRDIQPGEPFPGRGLITLPDLQPNPEHGRLIYASQCAGCHGKSGEGSLPEFPPLWGPDSFNDGAGMATIRKMAAFVQHNMPQNRPGILSDQDAYDVAAFVHAQPRPAFNPAYKHY